MNTTIIIILVVLILIVGISIVLAIIKGNKEDDTKEIISSKTFKEETPVTEEPEIFTPKMQEEAPVMQDLSTPTPTIAPVSEPETPTPITEDVGTQSKDLYNQEKSLPDTTQVSEDLKDLTPEPSAPTPELGSTQANTPPSPEKVSDDMQSIMDALNSSVPIPPDVEPIQPVEQQTSPVVDISQPVEQEPPVNTPTPEPTPSTVDINKPMVEEVPIMPDINTRKPVPPVIDVTPPVIEQVAPAMPNIETPIPEQTVDINQPMVEEVPIMPDINTRRPATSVMPNVQTPTPEPTPTVDINPPVVEQPPVNTQKPVQPIVDFNQPMAQNTSVMPDVNNPPPTPSIGV